MATGSTCDEAERKMGGACARARSCPATAVDLRSCAAASDPRLALPHQSHIRAMPAAIESCPLTTFIPRSSSPFPAAPSSMAASSSPSPKMPASAPATILPRRATSTWRNGCRLELTLLCLGRAQGEPHVQPYGKPLRVVEEGEEGIRHADGACEEEEEAEGGHGCWREEEGGESIFTEKISMYIIPMGIIIL